VVIYREIKIKALWKLFVDAAVSSATVMYIVASASVFAWLLTTAHIASDLSAALLAISSNKYVILLLINIIFLIAGCFLDANSAFYILIPIMIPIMTALDIDRVHFGVFVTVNMAIGLITPPVGINLYVGCKISDLPVAEICRKIVPFLVAGVIALIVITYIPQITMLIPNLVTG
jgi:C4-dicarboxylate transporter DctM subunit